MASARTKWLIIGFLIGFSACVVLSVIIEVVNPTESPQDWCYNYTWSQEEYNQCMDDFCNQCR